MIDPGGLYFSFEILTSITGTMVMFAWCWLQVLRNKPDFRRKPWSTISNSAKDFVQKLLVKDPRTRLTAAQALCMY